MKNKIIKNTNYTSDKLNNDINKLKKIYKNKIKVEDIGESTQGEKIKCLKIGDKGNKIFINASHHANEWLTSLVIMRVLENLLNKKSKFINKKYYKKIQLIIVPMVNPDGVNYSINKKDNYWKANINGVDLNVNYPAGFLKAKENKEKLGVNKPGPRDYCGKEALSEKESRAIYNLTKKENFDITISLHSQGEEIYWNYLDINLEEAFILGKEMEKVSGYKLTTPEETSSYAGYKDWFIQEYKKPGFTIEMGNGKDFEGLTKEKTEKICKEIEKILYVIIEKKCK